MESSDRVGFVGLGTMGKPMVVALVRAGIATVVYDQRADAMASVVALGASPAPSLAYMAEHCRLICICVLDDDQVRDVIMGATGLLAAIADAPPSMPERTIVIHSTCSLDTIAELTEASRGLGVHVVDAPVSGAREGAEEGTLTIMVGGEAEQVALCTPILDAVGSTTFHVGSTAGAGTAAKLANNLMALCNGLVAIEALSLSSAYGINDATMLAIASVSTGSSYWTTKPDSLDQFRHPQGRSEDVGYIVSKDLRNALSAGRAKGKELSICAVAAEVGATLLSH